MDYSISPHPPIHGIKRLQPWLWYVAAAAVAAPAAIIFHELGHLFVGRALGVPEVVLHFASVSDSAVEGEVTLFRQGLQDAAGPLVTLLIVLGCCVWIAQAGPSPLPVAGAFAAGIRSVVIGLAYLLTRILNPGAEGNFDELNAAQNLGLPVEVIVAANVLLLLAAWVFVIRRIPTARRVRTLLAIGFGTVAGLFAYLGWVGPWLLP
jgi:hypothetical protein